MLGILVGVKRSGRSTSAPSKAGRPRPTPPAAKADGLRCGEGAARPVCLAPRLVDAQWLAALVVGIDPEPNRQHTILDGSKHPPHVAGLVVDPRHVRPELSRLVFGCRCGGSGASKTAKWRRREGSARPGSPPMGGLPDPYPRAGFFPRSTKKIIADFIRGGGGGFREDQGINGPWLWFPAGATARIGAPVIRSRLGSSESRKKTTALHDHGYVARRK